jgi:hypothetical protein
MSCPAEDFQNFPQFLQNNYQHDFVKSQLQTDALKTKTTERVLAFS